jgi:hypothetical protein
MLAIRSYLRSVIVVGSLTAACSEPSGAGSPDTTVASSERVPDATAPRGPFSSLDVIVTPNGEGRCNPTINGCGYSLRFDGEYVYVSDDWETTRIEMSVDELTEMQEALNLPGLATELLDAQDSPSQPLSAGHMHFYDAIGAIVYPQRDCDLAQLQQLPQPLACQVFGVLWKVVTTKTVCPVDPEYVNLETTRSPVRYFCLACGICSFEGPVE